MSDKMLAEVLIDCDGEDYINAEYVRPQGYPDKFNTAVTGLVLKKKYEWLRHVLMRKGLYKLTKVTDRELMGFHGTVPSVYDYFYPFAIVEYDGANTNEYFPGLITLTGGAFPVCGYKVTIDTQVPLLAYECVEQLESLPLFDYKGRYVNKIPIGRTEIKLLGVSGICFMKASNVVSKLSESGVHVFIQMVEALPMSKCEIPSILGEKVCKVSDQCTGTKLINKNLVPLLACLLDESRRMSFALGPVYGDILKQLKQPIGGDVLKIDGELTLRIKERA